MVAPMPRPPPPMPARPRGLFQLGEQPDPAGGTTPAPMLLQEKTMTEDLTDYARKLAEQLRQEGHTREATKLMRAAASQGESNLMLRAVDAVLQGLLTAVEAIDPKTMLMIEELRLSVDSALDPHRQAREQDEAG